jgi:Kef-type K+ transport system membrane component KefB
VTPAELNVRLLLAVVVVVLAVQCTGWVLARLGQPRVIGEILAGILLGPSLLGVLAPGALAYLFPAQVVAGLQILAQFGLVLFMFLVGMHLDIPSVRRSRRTVVAVAPAAVAVPFALALGVGVLVHPAIGGDLDPVAYSLFLGVAMAVTALPVLARLLVDVGLTRHHVSAVAVSCAAVNDVVAWCAFAIIAAFAGPASGRGSAGALATVGAVLAYLVVMLVIVRWLLGWLPTLPIWVALAVMLGSSWVAEQLGIHAVIGAFVAGVAMPRRDVWLTTLNERLDVVVNSLLLPIFFAVAGIATRVDQLTAAAVLVTVLVVAVASFGKMVPTALAARLVGERWPTSFNLGVLMNTRGVTELVMLSLGLQSGVINSATYTVMVLMALVTTLASVPLLAFVRRWTVGVADGTPANVDAEANTDVDADRDAEDGTPVRRSPSRPADPPATAGRFAPKARGG